MTQASHPPSFDALLARFEPIFARIAEGSINRENDRELPYEAVQWLKDAGFTSLRVPVEHGGSGATLPQFFSLLIRQADQQSGKQRHPAAQGEAEDDDEEQGGDD